jgi:excisionase family DNA binding protein
MVTFQGEDRPALKQSPPNRPKLAEPIDEGTHAVSYTELASNRPPMNADVADISERTTPAQHERELLSVSAAARLLGVSPSSLRAWAAQGWVPHHRTEGGHRRFELNALVEWLSERGGGPPSPPSTPSELVPTRIESLPEAADLVDEYHDELLDAFEEELGRVRPGAGSRPSSTRRSRVSETLRMLSEALSDGDLSVAYRDAEWEGYRHGAGGQPGDAPVTEALSLRRAIDRLIASRMDSEAERRSLQRALDRVVVRVASGYADGVQRRLQIQQEEASP